MTRRTLALAAAVVLATTACTTTPTPPARQLQVTVSDRGTESQHHLALAEGESVELTGATGPFTLTVASAGDTVEVKTSQKMAKPRGSGYDYHDTTDRFTVTASQPARFSTALFDGGETTFEVALVEKG